MILDKTTWIFIIAIIALVIVPVYNATSLHNLQKQAIDQNDLIVRVVNENNELIKHTNEHLINHTQAATNNTQVLIDAIQGLNITAVNEDLRLSVLNNKLIANLTQAVKHLESEVVRIHGKEVNQTSAKLADLSNQVQQIASLK